jgi:lipopolysaccharide export system protein LptA
MARVSFLLVLVTLFLLPHVSEAQPEKVKYKAETLERFKKKGEFVRRLKGNVVFVQKSTTIYCDSAFFYDSRNYMEAFGRVRIVDDSVTITSRKLYYDGNTRLAQLRENVVYTKGDKRLTTNNLDYNMDTEVGDYFSGGTLQDATNRLTSVTATYYAQHNYADFFINVVLYAPDYTLKSNNMHYNTLTKVATTKGPTEVIADDGQTTIHSDGGEFRTVYDQSIFSEGTVETPENILVGDRLFFDDLNKYYKAEGNVKLTSKERNTIIIGREGFYDKAKGLNKIYGNPVMKKIMEADTFYLSADTLVSIESKVESEKRILAYKNVKIFRSNLQGLADSAAYFVTDSLMVLYHDPILWNRSNQIRGDTIKLEISEKEIKKMLLRRNAFMVSQDTVLNFNQIKGRNINAYFRDNELNYMDVLGNGESIYYVLAEGDSITMGMNRTLCSNMRLRFGEKTLKNVTFFKNPEGKFIPPHELTSDIQRLEGFSWRADERPTLLDVLRNVSRAKPIPEKGNLPPSDKVPPREKSQQRDRSKDQQTERRPGAPIGGGTRRGGG